MTTNSPRQLVDRSWRYTIIGAVCALSNYAIMLVNDSLGGHYLLGTVIAFVIVTPMAYALHSWFTFGEMLHWSGLFRFIMGALSAYPVAAGLMVLLCSGLRLSVAIAWPIVTVVIFGWNFAAAHWSILKGLGLPDAATQPPHLSSEP